MPVFGPVRSRRLGLSLGVDLVPPKICSMDCVYCEVGRTTRLTLERAPYVSLETLQKALEEALPRRDYDVVTLTGSGEPTLNTHLPEVIRLVRRMTSKPLAILTNSTTLDVPEVFQALCEVDLVLASLDAAREESFQKVNRPAAGLHPEKIIANLARLREEQSGELWLEILLVKGINDTPEDVEALQEAISRIRPHRIQLHTVARPPAESWARPLSYAELQAIARYFPAPVEVLLRPPDRRDPDHRLSPEELRAYLLRRPAPLEELSESLGTPPEEIRPQLEKLLAEGEVEKLIFQGKIFYRGRKP